MEKIKQSISVKTVAVILFLVCVVMIGLSAVVVGVNANEGWYSQSRETVKKEIYQQTTFSVSDYFYEEGDIESLFPDEQGMTDFGYTIYPLDSKTKEQVDKPIHAANEELKSKSNTYTSTLYHDDYAIEVYLGDLDHSSGVPSEVYEVYNLYNKVYAYRDAAIGIGAVGLVVAICLFVFLMTAVGSKKQASHITKFPLDLLGVVCFSAASLLVMFVSESGSIQNFEQAVLLLSLLILGVAVLSLGYLLLFAARAKLGSWWKSTVIYQALRILSKIGRSTAAFAMRLPLIWKTVVAVTLIVLFNLVMFPMLNYSEVAMMLWMVGGLTISVLVLYIALGLKRLKEGGKRLAEGDFDYQIAKKGLFGDLREHADDLNNIGKGMGKAVEEKLKSERFRSELITNVSHDIKTPLTSIINYVDFLKNEDLDHEKTKEYLEVLDRQSQRLKKLTEDLVDASKASTGNVNMQLTPCQIDVLMVQTLGEYKEKAEASDLNFIVKLPDNELEIFADGRQLWRVFDNLLNNICKYSQPGTRVYINLEKKHGKAVITYRNTSKYELNITEEELLERFIRGDRSRHTEGSGLGLSIAQNLVQLQGGTFDIFVDGDLFKVVIQFELTTV